jgi:hypothetical protein
MRVWGAVTLNMTNFVMATIKENSTGKMLGTTILFSALPRQGEIILINNVKYWVERVEWKIRKNIVYEGEFVFEGVDVIVDTAAGK